jgi:hypothetical protein
MVYFQTKNHNLGKFWKVLQWKMLVFLGPFCLFYGQMVYFMAIWYILWYVVPRKIWQPLLCLRHGIEKSVERKNILRRWPKLFQGAYLDLGTFLTAQKT